MSAAITAYASSRDHDAVIALWQMVFPDDPPWNDPAQLIATKLTVLPELFLVAHHEAALVGTLVGGFDGVRGWMYHLATAPEFRRQGVASQLVHALEEQLRALGCKKLNLQVRAENADVTAFYKSLGYAIEPRVSLGKRL